MKSPKKTPRPTNLHDIVLGEIYLILVRFRPKSYKTGEIYAFLGRFRPKYLHDSSICDKIVNVCEVKYSQDEYELDKEEYERINRRRNTFIKETGLRHASWLTMITTEGLAKGMYSGMIQNVVTLDDLFE